MKPDQRLYQSEQDRTFFCLRVTNQKAEEWKLNDCEPDTGNINRRSQKTTARQNHRQQERDRVEKYHLEAAAGMRCRAVIG